MAAIETLVTATTMTVAQAMLTGGPYRRGALLRTCVFAEWPPNSAGMDLRIGLPLVFVLTLALASPASAAFNVDITDTGPTADMNYNPGTATYSATGNNAKLSVGDVVSKLALGGLTVNTGAGGAQAGDVTISGAVTSSSSNQLTLTAAGQVIHNAAVDIGGLVESPTGGTTLSGPPVETMTNTTF